MQVVFEQFLAFILNAAIYKRKRKPLQPMKKSKKKRKATAFREVEGLSQKSLTGSFTHILICFGSGPKCRTNACSMRSSSITTWVKWSTLLLVSYRSRIKPTNRTATSCIAREYLMFMQQYRGGCVGLLLFSVSSLAPGVHRRSQTGQTLGHGPLGFDYSRPRWQGLLTQSPPH